MARLKKQYNVKWVLIDYIALLKDKPQSNDLERSGYISGAIHEIAKSLDVHILAITEMTKAGQTGTVDGQAALAGHRRLAYDADMSAIIRKPKNDNVTQVMMTWEKFREGAAGNKIIFDKVNGFAYFREADNQA